MGDDEFGIYNFNFKKNMTAAVERCLEYHENATLPFYQCLCSGLASDSFQYTRYKYYFCKKAADLEKEESAKHMKEVGETVGIILGVCVLLFLLIFIYRKFKVQICRCLGSAFASIGMRQHYESCTRMFCVCCQKHPRSQLDDLPANQNLSGRPSRGCGKFCYSDALLGFMEFVCDCDCFRTRRAPKYMMPILGKAKPKAARHSSSDGGESGSGDDQQSVQLQPLRRMRSTRKAPPPPVPAAAAKAAAAAAASAPSMPDAPGFDPERDGTSTGKRRAPVPPPGVPYSAPPPQYHQVVHHQQHHQPHHQPHHAQHQPHQQYHQQPQHPPPPPPVQRGGPPMVPNEFTAQLNQAMVGRRWPSESEI